MAKSKDPNVIDGFSSVQAVRRARSQSPGKRAKPQPAQPQPAEKPPAKPGERGMRIGHTAMPARHEVRCYECGYDFVISGKMHNSICPKCHVDLDAREYRVEGEWRRSIRTVGDVHVLPDARVGKVTLTAGTLVLEGNAEEASIEFCRSLELCPGARFDVAKTTILDLRIRPGGEFAIAGHLDCRDLEIQGELRARVRAEGAVTVRQGGCLRGEFRGAHLVVEEGGGLKAKVFLGEEFKHTLPQKRPRVSARPTKAKRSTRSTTGKRSPRPKKETTSGRRPRTPKPASGVGKD